MNTNEILSHQSKLVSVTKKGLTVHTKKQFFNISKKDFPKILNDSVELFLSQYEIPFYGVISQIQQKEKDLFEIKINFTDNTPIYYRECVNDLLN